MCEHSLRSHSHWAVSDSVSVSDVKTGWKFAKEWVEYPLLVMIANAQCERTLNLSCNFVIIRSILKFYPVIAIDKHVWKPSMESRIGYRIHLWDSFVFKKIITGMKWPSSPKIAWRYGSYLLLQVAIIGESLIFLGQRSVMLTTWRSASVTLRSKFEESHVSSCVWNPGHTSPEVQWYQ